jgi:hypothetical protein
MVLQYQVGAKAKQHKNSLSDYASNGVKSAEDLLDFIKLLESDGNGDTQVMIDGVDLLFIFDRDNNDLATDGVRLEGIVGDDVSRKQILNAGASDASSAQANQWDIFDDALVA